MNKETSLLTPNKVRMTIEIELDDYKRDSLAISAKTEVLGGTIARLDWEGGLFDEVDVYRSLFNTVGNDLMSVLFDNAEDDDFMCELRGAIAKSINKILAEKRQQIIEE